jgi:hypothetical protein
MSTRSTFILALLALGMLVYFITVDRDLSGTSQRERDRDKLFVLEPESIRRLELVNVSGSYVFSKADSGAWSIESPVSFPADPNALSTLLSELEFSRRSATLENKEIDDLEQSQVRFGLSPARIQLNVRSEKKNYQLVIGNETSRAGFFYALITVGQKSEIAIIPQRLETLLSAPLDDWRSRKVFDFLTEDITGLNLRKNGSEFEVLREEKGVWKFSKPLMTGADEKEVLSFISSLAAMQSSGFVSDNAEDVGAYGLTTPTLSLEIRSGEKTEVLRVGSVVQDDPSSHYAQLASRPTVFKVNASYHQLIGALMEKLRDRRLVILSDQSQLESFKIEKAGLSLSAKAEAGGGEWRLDQEKQRFLDKDQVESFLKKLQELRAISFETVTEEAKKKTASSKTLLKITLRIKNTKNEPEEKVLSFSPFKKGELVVETPFRNAPVTVAESALPALPAAAWEWLGKKLDLSAAGDLSSIQWEQGGTKTSLEKDQEGKWPEHLSGKKVNMEVLDRQLELLAHLEVGAWSLPQDKGFGTPFLRLTLGHAQGRSVVEFGKELEDGSRLCRLPEEGLAFTVSKPDFLLLSMTPSLASDESVPAEKNP